MLRRLWWWIRGRLVWKPTEAWIEGNQDFGDYRTWILRGNLPQKKPGLFFLLVWANKKYTQPSHSRVE